MVGREKELEKLISLFAAALERKSSFIVISGEAGIGKTCLVNELDAYSKAMNFVVFKGTSEQGFKFSMNPFIQILRQVLDLVNGSVLDESEKEGLRAYENGVKKIIVMEEGSEALLNRPENLLFLLMAIFQKIAKRRPILVILEDFHWADSASAQLISLLAKNQRYERLVVVVTIRPEELITDEGRLVGETLEMMIKEGQASHMDLGKIPLDASGDLLGPFLGQEPSSRMLTKIWNDCNGNPFFMIETLKLMLETNNDQMDIAYYSDENQLPRTVKETVSGRFSILTPQEDKLLQDSAVIGKAADLVTLAKLNGEEFSYIADRAEHISRKTGLISIVDNNLIFEHEIVRQCALDRMERGRHIEVNEKMGKWLEEFPLTEESIVRLAHHYLNAENHEKSKKYSYMAAENCISRSAVIEAIYHLKNVLKNCDEMDELKFASIEKLGDAMKDLGDFDGAMGYYESLNSNPGNIPYSRILRKSAELYVPTRLGKGGAEKAYQMLIEAERFENDDYLEMGELASDRATLALWTGNPKEALRCSLLAEENFRKAGAKTRLALELTEHAIVMMSLGAVSESKKNIEEAMLIERDYPSPFVEIEMHQVYGMAQLHAGYYVDALFNEDRSIVISDALEYQYFSCWSHIIKGLVYLMIGDLKNFGSEAAESLKKAEMSGSIYQRAGCCALKAIHLNMSGDRDGALSKIISAEELMNSIDWTISSPMHGIVKLAQAELASNPDPQVIDELYLDTISAFEDNTYGHFFTGLTDLFAADTAFLNNEIGTAKRHLDRAMEIFKTMGNQDIVRKINEHRSSL